MPRSRTFPRGKLTESLEGIETLGGSELETIVESGKLTESLEGIETTELTAWIKDN